MPDRAVAQQHFRWSDPTAWFDVLYTGAEGNHERPEADGRGALVVRCALGEDAEALAQRSWTHAFEFVLECYTVQALPPELRPHTIAAMTALVGDNGRMLVVSRARNEQEAPGDMPVRRWRALMERTME
jgi:hypothetical protein